MLGRRLKQAAEARDAREADQGGHRRGRRAEVAERDQREPGGAAPRGGEHRGAGEADGGRAAGRRLDPVLSARRPLYPAEAEREQRRQPEQGEPRGPVAAGSPERGEGV